MKVFLFSPVSIENNGGAELYLLHLSDYLRRSSHQTKLITGLRFRSFLRWRYPTKETVQILRHHFSWADIVYCSYGFAGVDWVLLSLSRRTGTPVIAGHHAPILHHDVLHNLWMQSGGRFFLRKFAGHHVLNQEHERLLRQWGISNVCFIPCGIDRNMFSPKGRGPHHPIRFLFVGRPGWQKGLDILERAIVPLSFESRARCAFRIIKGVRHQEIPKHIQWADVAVVPSRVETSPAVVLEALSSGRPVLGSDILGIRELIVSRSQGDTPPRRRAGLHPGGVGWLVKAGSVEALKEGIESVVRKFTRRPEQWVTMSRAARQATRLYDHRELFARLTGFFASLRMIKTT